MADKQDDKWVRVERQLSTGERPGGSFRGGGKWRGRESDSQGRSRSGRWGRSEDGAEDDRFSKAFDRERGGPGSGFRRGGFGRRDDRPDDGGRFSGMRNRDTDPEVGGEPGSGFRRGGFGRRDDRPDDGGRFSGMRNRDTDPEVGGEPGSGFRRGGFGRRDDRPDDGGRFSGMRNRDMDADRDRDDDRGFGGGRRRMGRAAMMGPAPKVEDVHRSGIEVVVQSRGGKAPKGSKPTAAGLAAADPHAPSAQEREDSLGKSDATSRFVDSVAQVEDVTVKNAVVLQQLQKQIDDFAAGGSDATAFVQTVRRVKEPKLHAPIVKRIAVSASKADSGAARSNLADLIESLAKSSKRSKPVCTVDDVVEGLAAAASATAEDEERAESLASMIARLLENGVLPAQQLESVTELSTLMRQHANHALSTGNAAGSSGAGSDVAATDSADEIANAVRNLIGSGMRGSELAAGWTQLEQYDRVVVAPVLMREVLSAVDKDGMLTIRAPWTEEDSYGALLSKAYYDNLDASTKALEVVFDVAVEKGLPKGLLEGTFMMLYQNDVMIEEAFRAWRSIRRDPTDTSIKGLMQLQRWFDWLDEEDEEEEDSEDELDDIPANPNR